jgi:hypothetical protein
MRHSREKLDDAHLAKVLTEDEALASNIAKLPSLLIKGGSSRRPHTIQPNSRALSLASFQAAVRKSARVIETLLSSFLGKLLARS